MYEGGPVKVKNLNKNTQALCTNEVLDNKYVVKKSMKKVYGMGLVGKFLFIIRLVLYFGV